MMRRLAMVVVGVALGAGLAGAQQQFTDANLQGARFVRSDLREARFERCRLGAVQLLEITEAAKLSLRNCRIDDSSWQRVTLNDPRVEYSRIEGLAGYRVELDEWTLEHSELTELKLRYCELRYVDLENCTVRDLEAEYVSIPRGRWRNADLSEGSFEGADFSDGRFYRGSFGDARFTYTDFRDVVLENCDIRGLVINGVRIDELID